MDVSAITEQSLHSIKELSAFHAAPSASELGVGKRLGRDIARTDYQRDVPCHRIPPSAIK